MQIKRIGDWIQFSSVQFHYKFAFRTNVIQENKNKITSSYTSYNEEIQNQQNKIIRDLHKGNFLNEEISQ